MLSKTVVLGNQLFDLPEVKKITRGKISSGKN